MDTPKNIENLSESESHEPNTNDQEIQENGLLSRKKRDNSGIQTLFKITSGNHSGLKRAVDGKARIMITVNAIILSLIFSRTIGNLVEMDFTKQLPLIGFAAISLVSIVFAILSITPIKTQGKYTQEELQHKKGNLLYFGNFHNMNLNEFEEAFLELLKDERHLYTSLIRDIFHQGQELHRKFTFIRISLYSFLIAIFFAIISHISIITNECSI